MILTHLSLTNFRNFTRLDLQVPGGAVLLVGGNAQGKTSLLEAIYYLATFVSFHASNDRELINFSARNETPTVARLVAEFRRQTGTGGAPGATSSSAHRLEVRLIQDANGQNGSAQARKEILLDGVKRKVGEAIGAFNAVLFLPHMLRVIEGSPEERRRYLNLVMGQAVPRFAQIQADYNRALTQRNALLKALGERSYDASAASAELAFWDNQLAGFGAQIIYERIHAIQELERLAARLHLELTRGQEVLRLAYQPAYEPLSGSPGQFNLPLDTPLNRSGLSLEKIKTGFQTALERLHAEEIARGQTSIGPHRDDLRMISNKIDLGDYGSRGQARTAMLSLKLAEVEWMKVKTGQSPVLLLDEVLAELDPFRRADLLDRLSDSEQALLTTTDLDLFSHDFVKNARLWQVQDGQVRETLHET